MHIFKRLLSYSLKYKYRFALGIVFALLTALFNAISITTMIPLFDSFGAENKKGFRLVLTLPESAIQVKEEQLGIDSLDGLERIKLIIINYKVRFNNFIQNKESFEVVIFISSIVMPLYFFKLVFYLLSVYCIATTGYKAVRDIRQQLFEKVQKLPLTYFYKERSGVIMSRMLNDAEVISAVISSNLRDAIINFFYIVTHLVILLYLNAELLMIAIITVPIIILPVTLFTNKITKSTLKFQERLAELNANVQELISGIKIIRCFAAEDYEKDRFQEINHKVTHRNFKGQFYLQVAPNLVELMSSLVVLGFFAIGARLIFNGQFTQGEFMAFLLTLLFLLRPTTQLSQMIGKITQAKVAGRRIFELLDLPQETHEKEGDITVFSLRKSIEFKDLTFKYADTLNDVINKINLSVQVGETIALIGPSGSGKSTLMDLIPRFYDPTSGKIEIDGVNINQIHINSLRRKIGIVTQEIFLFHGTVADNIAYGKIGATRKDVIRAARLANAHDFILQMENGYDTVLGVRGLNLSGGQRQRLVIARALLRDPEILILDEATSALDSHTERLVNQALLRLFRNRTTFVIAHRLSTIKKVKKIIVMDKGQIIEMGDHLTLLAQNGLYAKLHKNQFADT